jgi:putative hydrolase of the HAD superfamily
MQFRAVIFDFGGVITSSPFEAMARYERARGIPEGFIRRVNATNPDDNAWAKFERSAIDLDSFDALFAAESAALGHRIPGADVMGLLYGEVRPRMVRALDTLADAGFALGCITNNVALPEGSPLASGQKAKVEPVFARFHHILESAKVGIRKPDPRIYKMMCEALAVAPGVCIYLDDLGINCKPAAALGMAAIKVAGEDQALAELGRLTGLPLAAG